MTIQGKSILKSISLLMAFALLVMVFQNSYVVLAADYAYQDQGVEDHAEYPDDYYPTIEYPEVSYTETDENELDDVEATEMIDDTEPTITFFDYWVVEVPMGTEAITFIIETTNIPDGDYLISVEGLPEGAVAPGHASVYDDEFLLRLTDFSAAAVGFYSITLTIYDEDGNIIAVTDEALLISVYDPAEIDFDYPLGLDTAEIETYEYVYPVVVQVDVDIDSYGYILNEALRQSGITPFVDANHRAMLPLRIVAEALGAHVGWVVDTRTVTINMDGVNLSLQVDAPLPGGMGQPVIVGDRTFVPIDFVAQMIGIDISWDAGSGAVYIQAEG